MKVIPSADGHTGAAVAGAGAAEDETVVKEMPLDGLEVCGTTAPEDSEAVDAGVLNEVTLVLDNDKVPLEVLVPEDAIREEEVGKGVALIGLEVLVLEDEIGLEANGTTEASAELVVELGSTAEELEVAVDELEDPGTELEVPAEEGLEENGELETSVELVVELGSTAGELEISVDELEDPGTELELPTEEVAIVEVGRTIGVVSMDGVVAVGKTIGVDDVAAVVAVVACKRTLVLPLPVHCDD